MSIRFEVLRGSPGRVPFDRYRVRRSNLRAHPVSVLKAPNPARVWNLHVKGATWHTLSHTLREVMSHCSGEAVESQVLAPTL